MSDQLRAVNKALKRIHSSLSKGNKTIEDSLSDLKTAVNRANGKGFWGALSKAYDNLQGIFGKNFKGRSKLKKELKSIAESIADEAAETADLIDKLVQVVDDMPETSVAFTDRCL